MKTVSFDNITDAKAFQKSMKGQGLTATRSYMDVVVDATHDQIRQAWLRMRRIPSHRIFEWSIEQQEV